jgi:hypothetical protein
LPELEEGGGGKVGGAVNKAREEVLDGKAEQ